MKITIQLFTFLILNLSYLQLASQLLSPTQNSAARHLVLEFNQCHEAVHVYKDHNSGCNQFFPLIEGDATVMLNQAYLLDVFDGRGSIESVFLLEDSASYSNLRYTYPENNFGARPGFDVSGATTLSFFAKGSGNVEFMLGGTNRKPFNDPDMPFQDGVDIRSTGIVDLTPEWKPYTIDLSDDIFWVYKDPLAGANNKYPEVKFMADYEYMGFSYDADDGEGNSCMQIDWNGTHDTLFAGFFLFPPEGEWEGTQGLDLRGLTKIRFKAKMNKPGRVRALFGKQGDSSRQLTYGYSFTDEWKWYEWAVPRNRNYSNIVGGFGLFFGGNLNTPDSSSIYIDSVYYEGAKLAGDFSNLITGFSVVASNTHNADQVEVYIDEVSYDKVRENDPRFIQSFIVKNDSIDVSEQMSAHTYDNALSLLAFLALYNETGDNEYLERAKLIGEAFLFAMNYDRRFLDKRLRNVNTAGHLVHWNGLNRLPGWWDNEEQKWFEDLYTVGTSAGNMAWAGLALVSLYQQTKDLTFLTASKQLADWCLEHTGTQFGFTGGLSGPEDSLQSATWKSTEHNIDLFALYIRLFDIYKDSTYLEAANNARDFVYQMWDGDLECFWTGTTADGFTPNTSNIASDVQFWYIQAFQDISSPFTACMQWARDSCYLSDYTSINYEHPLYGFDFNNLDRDGVWFEGTAQAALSYKLLSETSFADSLLDIIEYVQSSGPNHNGRGIVAADHHGVTTGFDWEYHNRLHIGATSWYIFAQLGVNPYYINDFPHEEPPVDTSKAQICLNFSPYYKRGQDPRRGSFIPPEQIKQALEAIDPYCDCIRIFSSSSPLDTAAYMAKRMGFKTVIAGAWLDRDTATNRIELDNVIKLAQAGAVDKIIVGSETLLRNELRPEALIDYMNYVRAQVPSIPISTADVHYELLAHPEVIDAADFVFYNVYPYWSGELIDHSIDRFHKAYECIKAAAGEKEIIVSETGWPTEGNTVERAEPSLENMLTYMDQVRSWSAFHEVPVVWFEAFDEPWKYRSTTPQEAHWGLQYYDPDLDSLISKPGVDSLLCSPIEIDTTLWACTYIGNEADTPRINLTEIPVYGDQNGILRGFVDGVRTCDYNLVAYIKVNGRWWVKPTYAQKVTPVSADGYFFIDVVTGGLDRNATEYQLFLIDKCYDPPAIGNKPRLPDSLYEDAVTSLNITRTPFDWARMFINNASGYRGDTVSVTIMVEDFKQVQSANGGIESASGLELLEMKSLIDSVELFYTKVDKQNFTFSFAANDSIPITLEDGVNLFEIKAVIPKTNKNCRTIWISNKHEETEILQLVENEPQRIPILFDNGSICPLVPPIFQIEYCDTARTNTLILPIVVEDFYSISEMQGGFIADSGMKILGLELADTTRGTLIENLESDSGIAFSFTSKYPFSLSNGKELLRLVVELTDSLSNCGHIQLDTAKSKAIQFRSSSWRDTVSITLDGNTRICPTIPSRLEFVIEDSLLVSDTLIIPVTVNEYFNLESLHGAFEITGAKNIIGLESDLLENIETLINNSSVSFSFTPEATLHLNPATELLRILVELPDRSTCVQAELSEETEAEATHFQGNSCQLTVPIILGGRDNFNFAKPLKLELIIEDSIRVEENMFEIPVVVEGFQNLTHFEGAFKSNGNVKIVGIESDSIDSLLVKEPVNDSLFKFSMTSTSPISFENGTNLFRILIEIPEGYKNCSEIRISDTIQSLAQALTNSCQFELPVEQKGDEEFCKENLDIVSIASDIKEFDYLNIYPNPASDQANIEFNAKTFGKGSLAIYNAAGKLILEQEEILQAGDNIIVLDKLEEVKPGLLLIKIQANSGQIWIGKLLKM